MYRRHSLRTPCLIRACWASARAEGKRAVQAGHACRASAPASRALTSRSGSAATSLVEATTT
eukprot:3620169-Heterocapsa_arctica.AAC.1